MSGMISAIVPGILACRSSTNPGKMKSILRDFAEMNVKQGCTAQSFCP
jgi:hypothetical protein